MTTAEDVATQPTEPPMTTGSVPEQTTEASTQPTEPPMTTGSDVTTLQQDITPGLIPEEVPTIITLQ